MQAKRAVVWVVVAVTFMLGYWIGAGEEPAEAQSDFLVLSELRSIRSLLEDIAECVGQNSYRPYGCEIEVEVK